jgi:hypothetical protein
MIIINTLMCELRQSHRMDYDYDNYYACRNGSNCCDRDYCRCGQITNIKITTNVKVWELLGLHFNQCNQNDLINYYCIERILSLNNVWDKNNWGVNISGGYYGEEIHGCSLKDETYNTIEKQLEEYNELGSYSEGVEYVLNLEYGYIIEDLKDSIYSIIEIPRESIRLGQQDYRKKLDKSIVDYYKDYPLPRGVVVECGDTYKCLDGYHRISAAEGNISVLLAEKL